MTQHPKRPLGVTRILAGLSRIGDRLRAMPRVELTSHMRRHVDLAPGEVDGSTLREVLDVYLARDARARSYVFDEQGALRHHVSIFVDGVVVDRHALDVAITKDARVYVMQALSGG